MGVSGAAFVVAPGESHVVGGAHLGGGGGPGELVGLGVPDGVGGDGGAADDGRATVGEGDGVVGEPGGEGLAAAGGDVGGEHTECAAHHADRSIGVTATAASIHLLDPAEEPGHQPGIAPPVGEESQILGDGGKTVDTRAALARALPGEVMRQARRLCEPAPRGAERHHDADAGRDADGTQPEGRIGHVEVLRTHPCAAVATDEESGEGLRRVGPPDDGL